MRWRRPCSTPRPTASSSPTTASHHARQPAFVGLTGARADVVASMRWTCCRARAGRSARCWRSHFGETRQLGGRGDAYGAVNGPPVVAWVSITTVADGAHVGHLVITLVDITERKSRLRNTPGTWPTT